MRIGGAGRGAGGGEGDSIPFPPHDSPGPDRRPLPHSLTYAGGPPHPIAEARGLRRRFDQLPPASGPDLVWGWSACILCSYSSSPSRSPASISWALRPWKPLACWLRRISSITSVTPAWEVSQPGRVEE